MQSTENLKSSRIICSYQEIDIYQKATVICDKFMLSTAYILIPYIRIDLLLLILRIFRIIYVYEYVISDWDVYIKKTIMQSMNRFQRISPQTMVYARSTFFCWNQMTVNGWTTTLTLNYKLVMKDASNYSITWQGLLLVGVK